MNTSTTKASLNSVVVDFSCSELRFVLLCVYIGSLKLNLDLDFKVMVSCIIITIFQVVDLGILAQTSIMIEAYLRIYSCINILNSNFELNPLRAESASKEAH